MSLVGEYLLAALISAVASADRVAFAQLMVSRPIVVAPLIGLVFGEPMVGLQVGLLLELLWLGRLPVGAAIPPDDTQIAIGATVAVMILGDLTGLHGMPLVLLTVLTAIPFGKCGQLFDRLAREANGRLNERSLVALAGADTVALERLHLRGLLHFVLAGLATSLTIIVCSCLILGFTAPWLLEAMRHGGLGVQYSLVLIGAAVLLGTINVSRGATLFTAAFAGTLLALWLR
ncbi:MAG: PTS sugar transporter subunit IIC [Desulfuromonadales bacterium]|nr:PTS sugar transporter subunit IIC [Desulfuromonadales bacterium]